MSKGRNKKRIAEALDDIASYLEDIKDSMTEIHNTILDESFKREARQTKFHKVTQEIEDVNGGYVVFVDNELQKDPLHIVLTELGGTIVSTVFDPKQQETTWIVEK